MKTYMKHLLAGANDGGVDRVRGLAGSSTAANGCAVRRGVAAFTLVDALLASGILVIFLGACLSAILVNQITTRKAKEEAIAMDFLTKYVESIKSLPFDSVVRGQPICGLYNGSGLPLIALPPDTNWVALDTTNYLIFHNDLVWLLNRNPKLQVNLNQTTVSGVVHDKQFNIKFDWDPPLSKGQRLEVQVDFLRTVNVPTL